MAFFTTSLKQLQELIALIAATLLLKNICPIVCSCCWDDGATQSDLHDITVLSAVTFDPSHNFMCQCLVLYHHDFNSSLETCTCTYYYFAHVIYYFVWELSTAAHSEGPRLVQSLHCNHSHVYSFFPYSYFRSPWQEEVSCQKNWLRLVREARLELCRSWFPGEPTLHIGIAVGGRELHYTMLPGTCMCVCMLR